MEIVLAILAVVALLGWTAYARWGSLWVGCAAFIALGYVLAPPLWTTHIGPIPLTIDRILLMGFGAAFVWKWRQGDCRSGMFRPPTGCCSARSAILLSAAR
jgi:hypothetical protein